jgi:hypothetical protein
MKFSREFKPQLSGLDGDDDNQIESDDEESEKKNEELYRYIEKILEEGKFANENLEPSFYIAVEKEQDFLMLTQMQSIDY